MIGPVKAITGLLGKGTYELDETAQKVTVTLEGWSDPKTYDDVLDGSTLDLTETYSSYHLVKQ